MIRGLLSALAFTCLCPFPAPAAELLGGGRVRLGADQTGPVDLPILRDTAASEHVAVVSVERDGLRLPPDAVDACLLASAPGALWQVRLTAENGFSQGSYALKLMFWSDPGGGASDLCRAPSQAPPPEQCAAATCRIADVSLTKEASDPRDPVLFHLISDAPRVLEYGPDGAPQPVYVDLLPSRGVRLDTLWFHLVGTLQDGTRAADRFSLCLDPGGADHGPRLVVTPAPDRPLRAAGYLLALRAVQGDNVTDCPATAPPPYDPAACRAAPDAANTPLTCQTATLTVERKAGKLLAPSAINISVDRAPHLAGLGDLVGVAALRTTGPVLREITHQASVILSGGGFAVPMTRDGDPSAIDTLLFEPVDSLTVPPGGVLDIGLNAESLPRAYGTYAGALSLMPLFGTAEAVVIPVKLTVRVWWLVHLILIVAGIAIGTAYRRHFELKMALWTALQGAARMRAFLLHQRQRQTDPVFVAEVNEALSSLEIAIRPDVGGLTAESVTAAVTAAKAALEKALADLAKRQRAQLPPEADDAGESVVDIVRPQEVYKGYEDIWRLDTGGYEVTDVVWRMGAEVKGRGIAPALQFDQDGELTVTFGWNGVPREARHTVTLRPGLHPNDPRRLARQLRRAFYARTVVNGLLILFFGMAFLQTVAAGVPGMVAAFLWGLSADITASQLSGVAREIKT